MESITHMQGSFVAPDQSSQKQSRTAKIKEAVQSAIQALFRKISSPRKEEKVLFSGGVFKLNYSFEAGDSDSLIQEVENILVREDAQVEVSRQAIREKRDVRTEKQVIEEAKVRIIKKIERARSSLVKQKERDDVQPVSSPRKTLELFSVSSVNKPEEETRMDRLFLKRPLVPSIDEQQFSSWVNREVYPEAFKKSVQSLPFLNWFKSGSTGPYLMDNLEGNLQRFVQVELWSFFASGEEIGTQNSPLTPKKVRKFIEDRLSPYLSPEAQEKLFNKIIQEGCKISPKLLAKIGKKGAEPFQKEIEREYAQGLRDVLKERGASLVVDAILEPVQKEAENIVRTRG